MENGNIHLGDIISVCAFYDKKKNPPWEKNIFFQKQGDITVWIQYVPAL